MSVVESLVGETDILFWILYFTAVVVVIVFHIRLLDEIQDKLKFVEFIHTVFTAFTVDIFDNLRAMHQCVWMVEHVEIHFPQIAFHAICVGVVESGERVVQPLLFYLVRVESQSQMAFQFGLSCRV